MATDKSNLDAVPQDDRVFRLTRVVAACVVPFLVAAFVILYVNPDRSGERFAWKIQPHFTEFWIGAGYLGGGWFFLNVVFARHWHHVTRGFPPVCAFVWMMGAATAMHWDRFDIQHVPFRLWLVLYVLTPVIVPALWLWNRRSDPREPAPGAVIVAQGLRWSMALVGAALLVLAGWMFLDPATAIAHWSWKLTPLTARVLAGWFSLSGVGGIVLALEPRWAAWRVLLQSMMIWLALLSVGVWRAWNEFDTHRIAFMAVIAVPASLLGLAALYAVQERRPRH